MPEGNARAAMHAPTTVIAACLCGQLRTFVRHDLRRNIRSAMIDPVRRETDVFATISFNVTASRWLDHAAMSSVRVDTVRDWLAEEFNVVEFATRDDPTIVNGITVHTPCLPLIVRHEELRKSKAGY